jgi:hypothetical protein
MVEQLISSMAATAAEMCRRWSSERPYGKATRSSAGMRPCGDGFRLAVALALGRDLAVRVSYGDVEGRNAESPYPVEAGIDPGATVMDSNQADLAFTESPTLGSVKSSMAMPTCACG